MRAVFASLPNAILWVALASFAGLAHAASFDERIKVPAVANAETAKPRLEQHFSMFALKRDSAPGAFVRDRAAWQQWRDLEFIIKVAIDEGAPLAELASFGLVQVANNAYTIDLQKFPQWQPLDTQLLSLADPRSIDALVPALRARGFRIPDVEKLKDYVATHDSEQMAFTEAKPLIESFARRLQQQRLARRPQQAEELLQYRFQKESAVAEAHRQWALGLLESLDNQRQRILVSYLEEIQYKKTYVASSDSLQQDLESEVQPLVSGAYVKILAQEEAEQAQRSERRRQARNAEVQSK